MASVGHIAVGLLGAAFARRLDRPLLSAGPAAVVWVGLSMLPDADVVGLAQGIPYGSTWGHRGATHSIGFALVIGLLAAGFARLAGRSPGRLGGLAAAVVLSHPLLDMLTDGGLGCALAWPLADARLFLPWRPMPVSPIGPDYFGARGLRVALGELRILSPVLLLGGLALWRGRKRTV